MKNLAGLEVNNQIFKLITERVSLTSLPYEFWIDGVNAYGGKLNNAYSTFKKIEKWAVSKGAEVKLVEEVGYHLIVEITDPIAAYLEKQLNSIH